MCSWHTCLIKLLLSFLFYSATKPVFLIYHFYWERIISCTSIFTLKKLVLLHNVTFGAALINFSNYNISILLSFQPGIEHRRRINIFPYPNDHISSNLIILFLSYFKWNGYNRSKFSQRLALYSTWLILYTW